MFFSQCFPVFPIFFPFFVWSLGSKGRCLGHPCRRHEDLAGEAGEAAGGGAGGERRSERRPGVAKRPKNSAMF